MLLTIAFIVFAMVTLAALEIMLFWQLGARDCRRSSSQRLLGAPIDPRARHLTWSRCRIGKRTCRPTRGRAGRPGSERRPPLSQSPPAWEHAAQHPRRAPAGATAAAPPAAGQSTDAFGRIPELVTKAHPCLQRIRDALASAAVGPPENRAGGNCTVSCHANGCHAHCP
jgi:hypothetical protein